MAEDYSKPGNDGGVKPPSIDRTIEQLSKLPAHFDCNHWYGVTVRVQQTVESCANVNYQNLLDRALGLASGICHDLGFQRCGVLKECPKYARRFYSYEWNCRKSVAHLEVSGAIHCVPEGGAAAVNPPMDRVDVPTAEELKAPNHLADLNSAPIKATDSYVESYPPGKAPSGDFFLDCGHFAVALILQYTFRSEVEKCPANYQPFVDRALEAVKLYAAQFYCHGQECGEHPAITIKRKEWACHPITHDGMENLLKAVDVTLYFELMCKKP